MTTPQAIRLFLLNVVNTKTTPLKLDHQQNLPPSTYLKNAMDKPDESLMSFDTLDEPMGAINAKN